jgi:acyl-CoA thioesterase-1
MSRRGWFFALLLLPACNRPQQAPQPRPAAPPAPPAASRQADDTRPVIAAFGDSLTAGYGVEPGQSYPDHLQRMLDERGYAYRVVNLGISGDTTDGGVARLDGALLLKPKIVILELGANDGLRGLPLERTRANLDLMLNAFQGAGAKVILAGMTLPRNYGAAYVRDFERIFRDLARQRRAVLIPFFLEGVAMNPALMQPDGLHPNAEGCRKVAELVFRHLEPLLEKQGARRPPKMKVPAACRINPHSKNRAWR